MVRVENSPDICLIHRFPGYLSNLIWSNAKLAHAKQGMTTVVIIIIAS